MEKNDLIGTHALSGVDRGVEKLDNCYEDSANKILFVLDGVTYKAVENPDDGYRSYCEEIQQTDEAVKNTFNPCSVFCKMRDNSDYEQNDIIEMYDVATKKLVLAIGTDNNDDYYPYCVMEYNPENMEINAGR